MAGTVLLEFECPSTGVCGVLRGVFVGVKVLAGVNVDEGGGDGATLVNLFLRSILQTQR